MGREVTMTIAGFPRTARHSNLPTPPRFSAAKPQPLSRPDDSVRANTLEGSDPFFPPKESLGKSAKPIKKASALVRGLAAFGIYTNRPQTGELQLAKLVNRLNDDLSNSKLEVLTLGNAQENGVGPAQIRLGDKEYTFQKKIMTRFSFLGSGPFMEFVRYTLVSADKSASLVCQFMLERPYEVHKLVYRNARQGMKLNSRDVKVINAAQAMFSNMTEKTQKQANAIIEKSKDMDIIEDLEL